jgi:hypothetical protein
MNKWALKTTFGDTSNNNAQITRTYKVFGSLGDTSGNTALIKMNKWALKTTFGDTSNNNAQITRTYKVFGSLGDTSGNTAFQKVNKNIISLTEGHSNFYSECDIWRPLSGLITAKAGYNVPFVAYLTRKQPFVCAFGANSVVGYNSSGSQRATISMNKWALKAAFSELLTPSPKMNVIIPFRGSFNGTSTVSGDSDIGKKIVASISSTSSVSGNIKMSNWSLKGSNETNKLTINQEGVETNTSGLGAWCSTNHCSLNRITTDWFEGSACAEAKLTAEETTRLYILTATQRGANPSKLYNFRVRFKAPSGKSVGISGFWFGEGGFGDRSTPFSGSNVTSSGNWQEIKCTATSTSFADYYYWGINITANGTSDFIRWDDAWMVESNSDTTASLTRKQPLSGSIACSSSLSVPIKIFRKYITSISCLSNNTVKASIGWKIKTSISSTSTASGYLNRRVPLSGNSGAVTTVAGSGKVWRKLISSISESSGQTSYLTRKQPFVCALGANSVVGYNSSGSQRATISMNKWATKGLIHKKNLLSPNIAMGTNYSKDTTGFLVYRGITLESSTEKPYLDNRSLKCTTTGSGDSGVRISIPSSTTRINQQYTFAVRLWAPAGKKVALQIWNVSGNNNWTNNNYTGIGDWEWVSVSHVSNGTNIELFVYNYPSPYSSFSFYIAQAQFEEGSGTAFELPQNSTVSGAPTRTFKVASSISNTSNNSASLSVNKKFITLVTELSNNTAKIAMNKWALQGSTDGQNLFAPNVITGTDYSQNTTGFGVVWNGQISSSGEAFTDGTRSLKYHAPGLASGACLTRGTGGMPYTHPGKTYVVSAKLKVPTGITLVFYPSYYNWYSPITPIAIKGNDQFQEKTFSWTNPSDKTVDKIIWLSDSISTYDVYTDSMIMQEGSSITYRGATLTASLTRQQPLTGTINCTSGNNAIVKMNKWALKTTFGNTSNNAAYLNRRQPLSGSFSSLSNCSGIIKPTRKIASSMGSTSNVAGYPTRKQPFTTIIYDTSSTSGTIKMNKWALKGVPTSTSVVSATINRKQPFISTISETSSTAGALSVTKKYSTSLGSASTTTSFLKVTKKYSVGVGGVASLGATSTRKYSVSTLIQGLSGNTGSQIASKKLISSFSESSGNNAIIKMNKWALKGSFGSTSNNNGVWIASKKLISSFTNTSTTTGHIKATKPIVVTLSETSGNVAYVRRQQPFTAILSATSTLTSGLSVIKTFKGYNYTLIGSENQRDCTNTAADTTGFIPTGTNTVISSSTEEHYMGNRSLKIVADGSGSLQGAMLSQFTLSPNTSYVFNMTVKAPNNLPLYTQLTDGVDNGHSKYFNGTGNWLRVVNDVVTDNHTYHIPIIKTNGTQTGTYYLGEYYLKLANTNLSSSLTRTFHISSSLAYSSACSGNLKVNYSNKTSISCSSNNSTALSVSKKLIASTSSSLTMGAPIKIARKLITSVNSVSNNTALIKMNKWAIKTTLGSTSSLSAYITRKYSIGTLISGQSTNDTHIDMNKWALKSSVGDTSTASGIIKPTRNIISSMGSISSTASWMTRKQPFVSVIHNTTSITSLIKMAWATKGAINGTSNQNSYLTRKQPINGLITSAGNCNSALSIIKKYNASISSVSSVFGLMKMNKWALKASIHKKNLLDSNIATGTDFKENTSGFTPNYYSTLSSTTLKSRQGTRSLMIECPGSYNAEGAYTAATNVKTNTNYTLRVWFDAPTNRLVKLWLFNTGWVNYAYENKTGNGTWQSLTATVNSGDKTTIGWGVLSYDSLNNPVVFNLDEAQLEEGSATEYEVPYNSNLISSLTRSQPISSSISSSSSLSGKISMTWKMFSPIGSVTNVTSFITLFKLISSSSAASTSAGGSLSTGKKFTSSITNTSVNAATVKMNKWALKGIPISTSNSSAIPIANKKLIGSTTETSGNTAYLIRRQPFSSVIYDTSTNNAIIKMDKWALKTSITSSSNQSSALTKYRQLASSIASSSNQSSALLRIRQTASSIVEISGCSVALSVAKHIISSIGSVSTTTQYLTRTFHVTTSIGNTSTITGAMKVSKTYTSSLSDTSTSNGLIKMAYSMKGLLVDETGTTAMASAVKTVVGSLSGLSTDIGITIANKKLIGQISETSGATGTLRMNKWALKGVIGIIEPNLSGYWKINEGSGTTSKDLSENNNTGTLTGTPSPQWDTQNGVLLNGGSGRVDCGNPSTLNILNEVSYVAWVKANAFSGGYNAILTKNASQLGIALWTYSNRLEAYFGNGSNWVGYVNSAMGLSLNTWYCIVLTASSIDNKSKLYVNGVKKGNDGTAGNWVNSATAFKIGGTTGYGSSWNGVIDDVRVYNKVLSSEEILSIYNKGINEIQSFASASKPLSGSVSSSSNLSSQYLSRKRDYTTSILSISNINPQLTAQWKITGSLLSASSTAGKTIVGWRLIQDLHSQSSLQAIPKASKKMISGLSNSSTTNATIKMNWAVKGQLDNQLSNIPFLKVNKKIISQLNNSSTTQAILSATKYMISQLSNLSTTQGVTTRKQPFNAVITGQSSNNAFVKIDRKCIGNVDSNVQISTLMTKYRQLSATSNVVSFIEDYLTRTRSIQSTVQGNSTNNVDLKIAYKLASSLLEQSFVEGLPTKFRYLTGELNGNTNINPYMTATFILTSMLSTHTNIISNLLRLKYISSNISCRSLIVPKLIYIASISNEQLYGLSGMWAKPARSMSVFGLINGVSELSEYLTRTFGINSKIENTTSTFANIGIKYKILSQIYEQSFIRNTNIYVVYALMGLISVDSAMWAVKLGLFLGTKSLRMRNEILTNNISSRFYKNKILSQLKELKTQKEIKKGRITPHLKKSRLDKELE